MIRVIHSIQNGTGTGWNQENDSKRRVIICRNYFTYDQHKYLSLSNISPVICLIQFKMKILQFYMKLNSFRWRIFFFVQILELLSMYSSGCLIMFFSLFHYFFFLWYLTNWSMKLVPFWTLKYNVIIIPYVI